MYYNIFRKDGTWILKVSKDMLHKLSRLFDLIFSIFLMLYITWGLYYSINVKLPVLIRVGIFVLLVMSFFKIYWSFIRCLKSYTESNFWKWLFFLLEYANISSCEKNFILLKRPIYHRKSPSIYFNGFIFERYFTWNVVYLYKVPVITGERERLISMTNQVCLWYLYYYHLLS